MSDKYLEELLSLQRSSGTSFVAAEKKKIDLSIEQRDRFEETLINYISEAVLQRAEIGY